MPDCLVKLNAVGKHYPPSRTSGDRLRGLWRALRGTANAGQAILENIDFTVNRGDAVAILGENGAGKSTLLKIVAGVIPASSGEVSVNGRIGALLELGAGFHPEFSGRQNIRTAATLAALDNHEIDAHMAEIIAFAELGSAIDQPLKHYSSGMVVRLGFALITAIRPDILISDEVLAVGDESFQKKCIRWLEGYLASGGTLLLVSHSIYHVQKLCREAVWLHQGRIHRRGDVFPVSQAYLAHHEAKLRAAPNQAVGANRVRIESLRFNGAPPAGALEMSTGGSFELEVRLQGNLSGDALQLQLQQTDGALIARHRVSAEPDTRFRFGELPLLPGYYQVELLPIDAQERRCGQPHRPMLQVQGVSREFGSLSVAHQWH